MTIDWNKPLKFTEESGLGEYGCKLHRQHILKIINGVPVYKYQIMYTTPESNSKYTLDLKQDGTTVNNDYVFPRFESRADIIYVENKPEPGATQHSTTSHIDWEKVIETEDGREAVVLTKAFSPGEGKIPYIAVHVKSTSSETDLICYYLHDGSPANHWEPILKNVTIKQKRYGILGFHKNMLAMTFDKKEDCESHHQSILTGRKDFIVVEITWEETLPK